LTPFTISRAPEALHVTISIGLADTAGGEDTTAELLRRADQALYRAKRDGRNRVVADAA
jgi:two-component system cell cycle response regulator